MNNAKTMTNKSTMSLKDFAQMGEGQIAYLKEIRSDELKEKFPDLPPLEPGLSLWGLFGATGEPLIFSDARAKALEGAHDQELQTVTLQ